MGKARSIALPVLVVTLLFASCASTVPTAEFEAFRTDTQDRLATLEQELEAVRSIEAGFVRKEELQQVHGEVAQLLDAIGQRLDTLGQKAQEAASRQDLDALQSEVALVSREYEAAYDALDDLVRHAGYDSIAQLVQLGHDIIEVNRNIADLDKKIEQLRSAMALFVNQ